MPHQREERRVLGLVVLRGEEVMSLTIEGPPPSDERVDRAQAAPVGEAAAGCQFAAHTCLTM